MSTSSSSESLPTDNTSSPSPTSTGSGPLLPTNGNPTSLYLYTFLATLSLLFVIFGALVARSVHLRRRRNAVILASIAAGTYVPPPQNSKRRDDPLAPKPVLWEVHITPGSPPHDPEKGWAGILPVAGGTLVPVTQQTLGPLRGSVGSWRTSWSARRLLRVPFLGRRHQSTGPPTTPDHPSRAPTITAGLASSLELPVSSPSSPRLPSEPVHLAVLISMPIRTARWRAEHENGGAPVVEFGVTRVAYAHPITGS
ncbi:hypothetical protein EDB92DRAFT_2116410 [Lactarius akahatsu]|uniref:Uncharacterized protein n=1 Tax=Lactarius akahatsu TaxID=416441 RepID=A0AAD4QBA6_9AGAM|nr:hypothetical protein EDB92DRAFT_2116410 [Lactarius akahatsu]